MDWLRTAAVYFSLEGLPLVASGNDVAALISGALRKAAERTQDRDVIVIAQKIVSKAEGRSVDLDAVVPSKRAKEITTASAKDPSLVELILGDSREVLRVRPGIIIVEHRLGLVLANAGN